MPLGIVKLDRLDAGSAGIGGGDCDGARWNLPDIVVLQDFVSRIHIPYDDGHVLEPGVVAVGPHGDVSAGRRRHVLGELDDLLAELELYDAHIGVEHADKRVVLAAASTTRLSAC